MKLTNLLFGASMAATFGLSVVATLYLIPEPPRDLQPAVNAVCVGVLVFSVGILAYGFGVAREAKKIEGRILKQLADEWREKVHRLPPASEVAAHVMG
ncbi:hypothetical protein GHK68_30230, partial [Sinorhizobium meliloti]|uniref:hypothetical protein n=1 Tax=Rhizobium meliloti TaxID=382 RepID=UPI0013A8E8E6